MNKNEGQQQYNKSSYYRHEYNLEQQTDENENKKEESGSETSFSHGTASAYAAPYAAPYVPANINTHTHHVPTINTGTNIDLKRSREEDGTTVKHSNADIDPLNAYQDNRQDLDVYKEDIPTRMQKFQNTISMQHEHESSDTLVRVPKSNDSLIDSEDLNNRPSKSRSAAELARVNSGAHMFTTCAPAPSSAYTDDIGTDVGVLFDNDENENAATAIDLGDDRSLNMNQANLEQYATLSHIARPISIDIDNNDENTQTVHMDAPISPSPSSHIPPELVPIPPPRSSEPTARQTLIERERQARLERNKAKLKQKLALSREREEEAQKFEEADDARVNSVSDCDYSMGNSVGNSNVSASMRSLNIDLDMGLDSMSVPAHNEEHENTLNNGEDRTNSLLCTVRNEDQHVDVHSQTNGDKSKSASPLGFTMERFLQDGVDDDAAVTVTVAALGTSDGGDGNGDCNGNGNGNCNEIEGEIIDESCGESGTGVSMPDVGAIHILPEQIPDVSLMNLRGDGARMPGLDSNMSMEAGAGEVDHIDDEGHSPSGSSHVVSSDVQVDVHHSPLHSNDINLSTEVSDDVDIDNVSRNLQLPRLAQLAEAIELSELDYASVGNMPPRSVRDERHLPDISGMSHTSFDQTNTTVQASDISAGVESSHMGSCRSDINRQDPTIGPALTVDSPISNAARLPVESCASAISNTSVLAHQCDISIDRSDISDRKPAAIGIDGPRIDNLEEQVLLHLDDHDPGELKWSHEDICVDVEDLNQNLSSESHEHHLPVGSLIVETKEVNSPGNSYTHPNRVIRPGARRPGLIAVNSSERSLSKGHRRAQTTPNIPSFVDDFDYCKYNDLGGSSSNRESPFFGLDFDSSNQSNFLRDEHGQGDHISNYRYGAVDQEEGPQLGKMHSERRGLLESRNGIAMDDMIDSIFSSLRSMSTADIQGEIKDCDKYSSSTALSRAIYGRCLPLLVTVAIEIPVLLMIDGGGGRLCALIGRSRYQLLMAFLPLSCAVSGNCGLQAGTLATRAISHLHVTKRNYFRWLITEIQVSFILGLGIGLLIGLIAFQASGLDYSFGFVIFLANFICVLTSGLIGTVAPLIFRFVFHRDAGKWDSLLATAFQDIVASFVMVIFLFRVLRMMGPMEVGPDDICRKMP